jgi:hypothetical protein
VRVTILDDPPPEELPPELLPELFIGIVTGVDELNPALSGVYTSAFSTYFSSITYCNLVTAAVTSDLTAKSPFN